MGILVFLFTIRTQKLVYLNKQDSLRPNMPQGLYHTIPSSLQLKVAEDVHWKNCVILKQAQVCRSVGSRKACNNNEFFRGVHEYRWFSWQNNPREFALQRRTSKLRAAWSVKQEACCSFACLFWACTFPNPRQGCIGLIDEVIFSDFSHCSYSPLSTKVFQRSSPKKFNKLNKLYHYSTVEL